MRPTGNRDSAIAALRFRSAPPPAGTGQGGYKGLTFKPGHPMGGDQKRIKNAMGSVRRTTEKQIAEAVLSILSMSPNGEATILNLKQRMPHFVDLTEQDRQMSKTRPGEELWEQLLRNIISHYRSRGNIIAEGLVTQANRGKLRLTQKGAQHVKPPNF